MKELLESIVKTTKDISEGRLNTDVIKNIPKDRFDKNDYTITVNYDILGMNSIDKIGTVVLSLLMLGSFFLYGNTGVVILLSIFITGVLWSTHKLYNRYKRLIDEELPYPKIVESGDYELDPPYIIAQSKEAMEKFKQIGLYSHYLYDDVLYSTLKNSMASFTTSLLVLLLVICFIIAASPSYTVVIVFNVYFVLRIIFEAIRLKYTKLMVGIVEELNDAVNEDD